MMRTHPKSALIFAAGRGERLRPLTDQVPKPMCRVQGVPLIEHTVRQLAQAGIEHVVINHAYLGSQIRRHFKSGQGFGVQISYSPEPPGALETGGAIIQALPLLGDRPFMTVSSDILTDYPFSSLHLSTSPIHLVLVPKQAHTPSGDYGLDDQQHILPAPKMYTFGGIACFDPTLFTERSLRRFRLPDWLKPHIEAGQVSGEVYSGQWLDAGSMGRLQEADRLRSC